MEKKPDPDFMAVVEEMAQFVNEKCNANGVGKLAFVLIVGGLENANMGCRMNVCNHSTLMLLNEATNHLLLAEAAKKKVH